ncbi:diaminohydroxyphosphoribosylaminopyrimidine deaminase/5-amino-6-(5-phosphoribosylamino)uracil reductase [Bacillus pakistanensis]|uniref:Riboflavin biosynthesis protein RibD n=1 Tax=Rossellomorea pakistanensis TaxID=992288 RepID=A0ABS2N8J8_9BACI|nr:bifunctional diaminohydroxyphosphoribosylaminopyrimidine deaminase/5-amino-6-(5-phosphoribosylamino)uracil reductase RibD [Bacillus pakistanensis]MBM7584192.1 diaminohydroxyphosphoribosylaminopyrimidine deaminase/5-amino-6-(5-phosphoribosylamino)uracil reductase [Bacillus pakistanensis]
MDQKEYMELAISLARSTQGQTSPNPVVGAVVVNNGEVVGMGAHLRAGEAHAEVNAINQAGSRAKGADIYVTLEPCSHYGKTPPCADLIIEKGLKRVVVASTDPNPLVAGKGIDKLMKAGIEVETGICEEEALRLNEHFFHYIQTGTPFVTLKAAVTLDGKTASYTGDSKWITSSQSRLDVHNDRHRHDAILVGINTILQDDPLLTTRLPQGGKNPIRIILDTHLKIPFESQVITDLSAKTVIICGSQYKLNQKQRLESVGVEVIPLSSSTISVIEVLKILGERNVTSLYVEGGSTIHSSFLKEKAFQKLIMYVAPKLVGGIKAISAFAGDGFSTIAEATSLEFQSVDKIGSDLKIVATPKHEGG